MSSLSQAVPLTLLFAATGGYALTRWASLVAGSAGHPGDRVAELAHLAMALSMIGMVWGDTGPVSNWVQVALFSLLGLYFLGRAPLPGSAADRSGPTHCPAPLFHLLMCASMVWMVLAMPLLMPGGGTGGGAAAMDGMVMDSGSAGSGPSAPAWLAGIADPVTVAVAAALLVAGGYWLRRALAIGPHPTGQAPVGVARRGAVTSGAVTSGAVTSGAVTSGAVTSGAAPDVAAPDVATADAVPASPVAGCGPSAATGWMTPRSDALCHLAMCLGMAATFALMR